MKQIFMLPPAEFADQHTQLMFWITRLPDDERDVLLLFYHEGLSLEEIAHVLEKSEDDVAGLFYTAYSNSWTRSQPVEPLGAACVA